MVRDFALASASTVIAATSLLAAFLYQPAIAADRPVKIIAFGDSLTAGYMLRPADAFPAQLQTALKKKGYDVEIVNAGVSGDTTSGGLDRLAWTLEDGADAVILELGANDALRGISPDIARSNLDKMIAMIKAKGASLLLAGMRAPANWGNDFTASFDTIFPDLARKHDVPLYAFFLDGVVMQKSFVLDDGLHPSAKGVAEIVKRILPSVETLIATAAARKAASKS